MPRRIHRWYPERPTEQADLERRLSEGLVREFGVASCREGECDAEDPNFDASSLDCDGASARHEGTAEDALVAETLDAIEVEQGEVPQEMPLVPENPRRVFRGRSRCLPAPVLQLLRTIDVPAYRVDCLARIEQRLFGWDDRHTADPRVPGRRLRLTPSELRMAYRAALRDGPQETLLVVRRAVDEVKRLGYQRRLQDERRASAPPQFTETEGQIVCEDPLDRSEPAHGVRSFLEATPAQVPEFAINFLEQQTNAKVTNVLDATAGAGTVTDVVSAHGGRTLERDLNPLRERTLPLDLRQMELATTRRGFDLVFIHPPSIAAPSRVEGVRDLSNATPEEWLAAVTYAVEVGLGFLRPDGLLSLLVPEGVRHHGVVLPLSMADELVALLPEGTSVVSRRPLYWRRAAMQVSLGRTRVPTEHLLIARAPS